MFQLPIIQTTQQQAFRNAYVCENIRQSRKGVVCVTPEDIRQHMSPNMPMGTFELLLEEMHTKGFICIHRGTVKPRIITWIE